jgi:hypothetical protein
LILRQIFWAATAPVANHEIDFGRDSQFSWAFHASSLGNEVTPTRGDEAFIVESGLFTSTAHAAVVYLFAYFILNPTDSVARYFLLDSLLRAASGPWLPNQYASSFLLDTAVTGYEAIITSRDSHCGVADKLPEPYAPELHQRRRKEPMDYRTASRSDAWVKCGTFSGPQWESLLPPQEALAALSPPPNPRHRIRRRHGPKLRLPIPALPHIGSEGRAFVP